MTKSQLTPIYTVQTLTSVAGSLVGIFIPVYLLTLGYTVQDVIWFTLVQAVATLPFALATGWLSAKVQLKYLMAARVPTIIALLVLLISAQSHPISMIAIGLLQAAHFALYYIPLHVYFTVHSTKESVGRQFGLFLTLPKLAKIAGPLIAGLMATALGFGYVFGLAAILHALSSLPMLAMPPYQESLSFNLAKFRSLYTRYRRYFWLEYVENIQEEMDSVIWPLVVFLTLKSTLQVGAIGTIISAGSALFTYLVGRHTDRANKFRLLRLGGALSLILWLVRLGHITPMLAFTVSAAVGFTGVLIAIPFNTIIYNQARENNPREFIMFREVPIMLARTTVYAAAWFCATNLQQLFWLAIAAYAVFAVMPRFKLAS